MGSWGILPFENDNALDNLPLFEGANCDGIHGMLLFGIESRREDIAVMSIAIIDAIANGIDESIIPKYSSAYNDVSKIIEECAKDIYIDELVKEALSEVCRYIYIGNETGWFDWEERLKLLEYLKCRLERKEKKKYDDEV